MVGPVGLEPRSGKLEVSPLLHDVRGFRGRCALTNNLAASGSIT